MTRNLLLGGSLTASAHRGLTLDRNRAIALNRCCGSCACTLTFPREINGSLRRVRPSRAPATDLSCRPNGSTCGAMFRWQVNLQVAAKCGNACPMRHFKKYVDYVTLFKDSEYVAERLEAIRQRSVPLPNGCIEYRGTKGGRGYGWLIFGGKNWAVHRLLWMMVNGDVGDLVVDHKCRNRRCVNLAHLEPVTNAVNVSRGKFAAHGGVCDKGHPRKVSANGSYTCATCRNEKQRLRYAADPEVRAATRARERKRRALLRAA